jgi:hypothetical protein
MQLQTVHIRINDAATGQPTPVRLRVTDADGEYFAPFGHSAEFPTGRGEAVGGDVLIDGKCWAYIDGTCEIAAPPGTLTVEATKGPEFAALSETISLPLGKMALRFPMQRMSDFKKDGWYAGDVRAHNISPHAALLQAAAEDLAIVHVLARATPMLAADGHSYITYPNLEAFSGQKPALERDGHCVVVGTHNRHPVLGELALLHCHRVVYPLTFGGADATDDWSLGDWCDQCHRKKGLVDWTNAGDKHSAEALAHAILGHVDAIELSPERPEALQVWYQLLNAGVRIPIVGGSAKISNATALGAWRTYARISGRETKNGGEWIEAVRAGRTVVTTGPMLRMTANGFYPGDSITLNSGERIAVEATAGGEIEVLFNGKPIASGSTDLEISTSGWLAARAWSIDRVSLRAHTSPIWLDVPDVPQPRDANVIRALRLQLEAGKDWVEREGRFEKPQLKAQLLETFDTALNALSTR